MTFKEIVVVFRDRQSGTIETFVKMEGHGARVELTGFISLLAEACGHPAATMTRKGLESKLQIAAQEIILRMKSKTAAVASHIAGGA